MGGVSELIAEAFPKRVAVASYMFLECGLDHSCFVYNGIQIFYCQEWSKKDQLVWTKNPNTSCEKAFIYAVCRHFLKNFTLINTPFLLFKAPL